jgi:hypothetical protein
LPAASSELPVCGPGLGQALAAVDSADWLPYTSSGPDGAILRYPASWELDPSSNRELSLDPSLVYPHQSFAVRTTAQEPPIDMSTDGSRLPDLTGYPTDAAIIWVLYYDEIVGGRPFSGLSLGGSASPCRNLTGSSSTRRASPTPSVAFCCGCGWDAAPRTALC